MDQRLYIGHHSITPITRPFSPRSLIRPLFTPNYSPTTIYHLHFTLYPSPVTKYYYVLFTIHPSPFTLHLLSTVITMSKRIDAYRSLILDAPYEICMERARFYTESYRATSGEHPSLRAAKALRHTLEQMTVYILDCERLVGNRSSKILGTIVPVERGDINFTLKIDLKRLKRRQPKPFQIDEADERAFFDDILPYWEGRTVREKKIEWWKAFGLLWLPDWSLKSWINRIRQFGWDWTKQFYAGLVWGRYRHLGEGNEAYAANNPNLVNNVFDTQGHLVMGHDTIVRQGYRGVKERARRMHRSLRAKVTADNATLTRSGPILGAHDPVAIANGADRVALETLRERFDERFREAPARGPTADQLAFLEAVEICTDAAADLIRRFATRAGQKARATSDPHRRAELEQIQRTCGHIANAPPRTFYEALQIVWFNHLIATISYGIGAILAVGRVDQYLYPFYARDIAAGVITDDEVRELLAEFLIKLSYNLLLLPMNSTRTASELGADNVGVTVGGVDRDGNDAVNPLSYLFMDAIEEISSMTVSFSIRIAPGTNPDAWLQRAVAVYRTSSGPALFNDDAIVPALERTGVAIEDARDYAIIGCVEPTPAGNTFGTTSGNDLSLLALLEMVLTNGRVRAAGKPFGVETGDPAEFGSFDAFLDAYRVQLQHMIDTMVDWVDIKDLLYAEYYPNPFISMTLDGCIENALDMTQGGAKYNFSSISGRGLASVADALYAIERTVYEEEEVAMGTLLRALDRHWKKPEDRALQARLKHVMAKFGNDRDAVDRLAVALAREFCERVLAKPSLRRTGCYRPGFFSYGLYVYEGNLLGATPDGRGPGEPVSNSLSPANQCETQGATAVCNSVGKIDHTLIANGMALNMRFLPAMVKDEERRRLLAALIAAYFDRGGMHIQLNVVDQAVLKEAQTHPERYPDLVVRVSGYVAYFTDLGKPVQDTIIARTQFGTV